MNGANEPSKSSPDQSDQQQPQSSGNSVIHPSSSNNANAAPHHFVPLEFWTNMLARSNAAAAANAGNGVLQPQPIKTNIRLPPAFNLTATIQHLLQNPGTNPQMMPMAHQNPALVLRQALLGLMMGGGGGNEVPEGIDGSMDCQQRQGKGVDSPEERIGTAQHFVPSMQAQEEADEQMLDVDLKNDDLDEPLGLQVDTHFPASREADEEEQAATIEGTPNNGSQRLHQQRRARVGGSSAKTAEVWRFFSPRPDGEQAATCSICQKTIKATNSSTTGMIRHLKSVHHDEHKILQQARALRALKNSDETMREQMLRQWGFNSAQAEGCSLVAIQNALESSLSAMQYPTDHPPSMMPPVPKHSVEALLINGGGDGTSPENNRDFPLSPGFNPAAMAAQLAQLPVEQRQLLEQIENFKTSRPTSIERLQQQQQKKELAGGGGGKRMAEEAGSISPKLTDGTQREENNNFKEPKRPKQELAEHGEHGVQAATAAKVPMPAVNGTPKAGGNGPKKKPRKPTTIVPVQQLAKVDQNVEKEEEKLEEELDERQREESTRISEQMAAMFLVDNTEFLLDRVAFRQFIQSILPHYRMPSKEQFRREIIPRVGCQLDQLALFREELQRNNPFCVPMPPTIVQQHSQQQLNSSTNSSTSACQSSSSPVLSTPSMSNNSVISPSSSAEESGFHDEESIALGELQHPQLVVQQAAIRSQNISRGFTYSIDLSVSGNEGQQHGSGGNAS